VEEADDDEPVVNGDDDVVTTSDPPSPLSLDDVSTPGHQFTSTPTAAVVASDVVSSFVRSSARKSLGNGLAGDRWFTAQEKVMQQNEVSSFS